MAEREPSMRNVQARAWEGALEAGLSVAVGVVLGYYADRWLGTEPLLLFFFLIAGSIAGFRRLLRIASPPDTGSPDVDGEHGERDSDHSDDAER